MGNSEQMDALLFQRRLLTVTPCPLRLVGEPAEKMAGTCPLHDVGVKKSSWRHSTIYHTIRRIGLRGCRDLVGFPALFFDVPTMIVVRPHCASGGVPVTCVCTCCVCCLTTGNTFCISAPQQKKGGAETEFTLMVAPTIVSRWHTADREIDAQTDRQVRAGAGTYREECCGSFFLPQLRTASRWFSRPSKALLSPVGVLITHQSLHRRAKACLNIHLGCDVRNPVSRRV